MSLEIELKLEMTEIQAKGLSRLKPFRQIKSVTRRLSTTYFDTDDFRLKKMGFSLRLREAEGQIFQTVKARGEVVSGLSSRPEWEWLIPIKQLDLALAKKHFPSACKDLKAQELQPLFTTEFNRCLWLVEIEVNGMRTYIEVALDQGKIFAGGQYEALCELELELKEGDKEGLFVLLDQLKKQGFEAKSLSLSKAHRGFLLLGVK